MAQTRRRNPVIGGAVPTQFYPTPDRVVEMIASIIETPRSTYYSLGRTLRILDPCCGAGEALALLAGTMTGSQSVPVPIETFGVELHRDRAEEAVARLDHALASDLFGASMANGAFGLLFLNPPYDFDAGDERRVEQRFLAQCTRYLAEGGLLVFIVPRARLTVSARYLSTHYGTIRCWAFPSPERDAFDQVVLMAYRKSDPTPNVHAEMQIREWAEGTPEELYRHDYPVYSPSLTPSGDILFATRTVDPLAAAGEARVSGLWASTDITDTLWPRGDAGTRPLMPLRRGHIAMLVAAGFLDNLVLESGGRRILVKGRTSKEMTLVEDTPQKEVHRERVKTTVTALDLDDGEITDIAA